MLSEAVAARFGEHEGEWQEQIDYAPRGSQSLLLRGTRCHGRRAGYVLVFDDVKLITPSATPLSEVRAGWRTRSNPLTPIQAVGRTHRGSWMAAEAADARILARATQTIVNPVGR